MCDGMRGAVAAKYVDPRAHALRERYLAAFGGTEIPVPVESIAEDLLGLRIEERWDLGDTSGLLIPAERLIVLNAAEQAAGRNEAPLRRFRFTIAHELGHWICHAKERPEAECRLLPFKQADLARDADRSLEREANVFAAELLMPEDTVRQTWSWERQTLAPARRAARREPDSDALAPLFLRPRRTRRRQSEASEAHEAASTESPASARRPMLGRLGRPCWRQLGKSNQPDRGAFIRVRSSSRNTSKTGWPAIPD